MEQEVRISYLCTRAAKGRLTIEEKFELLEYIAIDPELIDLIKIEKTLFALHNNKGE